MCVNSPLCGSEILTPWCCDVWCGWCVVSVWVICGERFLCVVFYCNQTQSQLAELLSQSPTWRAGRIEALRKQPMGPVPPYVAQLLAMTRGEYLCYGSDVYNKIIWRVLLLTSSLSRLLPSWFTFEWCIQHIWSAFDYIVIHSWVVNDWLSWWTLEWCIEHYREGFPHMMHI